MRFPTSSRPGSTSTPGRAAGPGGRAVPGQPGGIPHGPGQRPDAAHRLHRAGPAGRSRIAVPSQRPADPATQQQPCGSEPDAADAAQSPEAVLPPGGHPGPSRGPARATAFRTGPAQRRLGGAGGQPERLLRLVRQRHAQRRPAPLALAQRHAGAAQPCRMAGRNPRSPAAGTRAPACAADQRLRRPYGYPSTYRHERRCRTGTA